MMDARPQRCEHECVCGRYLVTALVYKEPCPAGSDIYENCEHDSRCASHSSAQVPEQNPPYQELVDFIRWTQTFWKHGIEIMRKNNLVIKSDEPMEKLAFTFYSDLYEIDLKASHMFEEGYGDKNYKHVSDIECQTITSYPKPFEQSIRQHEREKVLDKLEQLLCAHHKYVGSYRVITGTNEEIYDELFDAMQELRKQEQP